MFEVGDIVVCVDDSSPKRHEDDSVITILIRNQIYRVTGTALSSEGLGVLVNGERPHTCSCCIGIAGWNPYRFAKLPPADPEFIELMRGLKAPNRVKEDA